MEACVLDARASLYLEPSTQRCLQLEDERGQSTALGLPVEVARALPVVRIIVAFKQRSHASRFNLEKGHNSLRLARGFGRGGVRPVSIERLLRDHGVAGVIILRGKGQEAVHGLTPSRANSHSPNQT